MGATTSAASLPGPEAADPSDVAVALEAARTLWDNADTDEALRWVSRAAEAAEQAGNDRRALELARAVADLRDHLAANPRAPAAAPTPKSVTPPPPAARKSSLPPPPPSMRPRPAEASPAKAAPPPPSMRPRPAEASPVNAPPAPSSMRPRPAEASPVNAPPAPSSMRQHPAEASPVRASVPPAAAQSKPPPDARPVPAKVEPAPKAAAAPVERTKLPYEEIPPATQATQADKIASAKQRVVASGDELLRVSVKASARDPELLIVRVLRKGQAVPPGCHEAFLSPAEQGVDLRSLRE